MPSRQRGSVIRRGKTWAVRYYDDAGARRFQADSRHAPRRSTGSSTAWTRSARFVVAIVSAPPSG